MSIRRAKLDDHWRHVMAHNYATRVIDLTTQNLLCINDGIINISSGICAIVGSNGVGKSALLAALCEVVGQSDELLSNNQKLKVLGSTLSANITEKSTPKTLQVINNKSGEREKLGESATEVHWVEPSFVVNQVYKSISDDSEFHSLLEPLSPIKLSNDELEILQYITNKSFETCDIFEITEYSELDPLPYFRVQSNGVEYGSESMGLGELSLLTIFWKLRVLPRNSILIIEEPETHVSPKSQRALMDIVAKYSDEHKISIILTTHSPAIISKIPQDRIILINREINKTRVQHGIRKSQINELLGEPRQYRGLILVEDKAAQQFLISLASIINTGLLDQFEILDAKGADSIRQSLTNLPKVKTPWLNILGIFDGDMRKEINPTNFKWPCTFLPGDQSPECILRESARGNVEFINRLSDRFYKTTEEIHIALQHVEGLDIHDWYTQLPRHLGCEHMDLMRVLVENWLTNNQETGKAFIDSISALLE
ncbi:ATP-dependent nuclease [Pseudomonas aeruginosa]|uniref:ATP-dependent nuclease n=1 Tax=Pseudomonas aeruginosa TaxID=287 RepID=UPI0029007B35|nr:AAA family ATPase [Pseudomonas aeruginosa]MDU0641558.1 AAA family ATPase [Pseudomonas aeruginosa]